MIAGAPSVARRTITDLVAVGRIAETIIPASASAAIISSRCRLSRNCVLRMFRKRAVVQIRECEKTSEP